MSYEIDPETLLEAFNKLVIETESDDTDLQQTTEMTTNNTNYQLLRLYLDSITNYDGNPHTLSIFLENCENLVQTFASQTDLQLNNFLLRAILGKLTGRALILIGSRSELKTWDSIKDALNLSFGDQRNIDCLIQDLLNLKPFKNEPMYTFGMRVQDSRSLIMSKLNSMQIAAEQKTVYIANYNNLALKTFIRGLRAPLQTNIRLRNPSNLEEAMSLLVEEENFLYSTQQVSFLNTQNHFKPTPRMTPVQSFKPNMYTNNQLPQHPLVPPQYTQRPIQYQFTPKPQNSQFNNAPIQANKFNYQQNFQQPNFNRFNSQQQPNFNRVNSQQPNRFNTFNNPQFTNFNQKFNPNFQKQPNFYPQNKVYKPEPMDTSSGNSFLKAKPKSNFVSTELFMQNVDTPIQETYENFENTENYYETSELEQNNEYYNEPEMTNENLQYFPENVYFENNCEPTEDFSQNENFQMVSNTKKPP